MNVPTSSLAVRREDDVAGVVCDADLLGDGFPAGEPVLDDHVALVTNGQQA